MSLKKDFIIGIILIFILFLTRNYYEQYRLFLIYVPVYIGILHFNLKGYYNNYSIMRFSSYKKWKINIILMIFEHSAIASIVLGLDKIFIVNVEEMQIGPLYLEYFLFISIVSVILIFPHLSTMRAVTSSVTLLALIKSGIFNLAILLPLYDARQFTIKNGIMHSIVFLSILNVIIYSIYFAWINRRVRIYGYDEIKKSTNSYFDCHSNISN